MGNVIYEGGSVVISVTFYDENDALVTPTAATWTLTDGGGNIVNSRDDVTISGLASTVTIVLGTNDTIISGSDNNRRVTVKAAYDSGAGTGLALRSEHRFSIQPVADVP